MNPFALLPKIDYLIAFRPISVGKKRKDEKRVTFSRLHHLTGKVTVEGREYRLQFTPYDDICDLLEGQASTKKTLIALYRTYVDGIKRGERTLFSPIIAGAGKSMEPVIIEKGGCYWQPYAVLDMDGPTRIEVDFYAIEVTRGEVIPIMSLLTEPGKIVMQQRQKRFWVWRRERPSMAMAA